MDKSEKIVRAFKEKFDGMTSEERRAYLQKMGLKFTDISEKKSQVQGMIEVDIPKFITKGTEYSRIHSSRSSSRRSRVIAAYRKRVLSEKVKKFATRKVKRTQ